jgi:hypothetical protein
MDGWSVFASERPTVRTLCSWWKEKIPEIRDNRDFFECWIKKRISNCTLIYH